MLAEPGRWSGKPVRIRRGPATVTGEATAWASAFARSLGLDRPGKARRGRPGSQETFLRPPSRSTLVERGGSQHEAQSHRRHGRRTPLVRCRTGARRAGDRRPAHRRRRRARSSKARSRPTYASSRPTRAPRRATTGAGAVTRGAVIAAAGVPFSADWNDGFGNPSLQDRRRRERRLRPRRPSATSPSTSTARARRPARAPIRSRPATGPVRLRRASTTRCSSSAGRGDGQAGGRGRR